MMDEEDSIAWMTCAIERFDSMTREFETMAENARGAASALREVVSDLKKRSKALDAEYGPVRRSDDGLDEYGTRVI